MDRVRTAESSARPDAPAPEREPRLRVVVVYEPDHAACVEAVTFLLDRAAARRAADRAEGCAAGSYADDGEATP